MRYLLNPSEKDAQAAYGEVMAFCNQHIDILFRHGFSSHLGLNNNQYPWWIQEMSARFDLVMGMPEIPAAQKEELKARFAFCVHLLQDDEFMPPRTNGYGWGSANMPVNTRGGRCVSACVLSDNPDAKPWLARAIEYVDVIATKVWSEDGSTVSGPHYASTQADPLINMAMPLYYAGVLPPLQVKYPRLANFTRLLIDRMTPPERRCNYTRVLPTLGHTLFEYDGNIGKFAVLMGLTDPKLAGQAYWMWKRAGGETNGFMDGIYYMHEEFKESQPECRSVVYPGSTAVLRNGFPRENETYMVIHAGNQGFDHYDRDVGSFLIYAKGAPLMMDFASMYVPNCWHSLWHNTLSWNVREKAAKTPCPGRGSKDCWFTGRTWKDHAFEPHLLLDRDADSQTTAADGYKEQAGEWRAQAFSPEADYVMAAIPLSEFSELPFLNKAESEDPVPWGAYQEFNRVRLKTKREWQRRFVFIKDEDLNGPNYFVVQDDLDGQDELNPQANFWCLADTQTIDKDIVRWQGQYEVDLDMYVAYPKQPEITSRRWWHTQVGPARATLKNGREEQIAAQVKQAPGKGGFTVVLYPRGRYELRPSFVSSPDGRMLRVLIGPRGDVIFCSRETMQVNDGDLRFTGTVGIIKKGMDYTAIVLPEAGTIAERGWEVQADGPAWVRFAGKDRITAQASGKGELRLTLGGSWAGKEVVLNGKPAGTFDAAGKITLALPAGGGALTSVREHPQGRRVIDCSRHLSLRARRAGAVPTATDCNR